MLHLGGGINLDNCKEWIEKGASKVSTILYNIYILFIVI
jgi:hypothetical protein